MKTTRHSSCLSLPQVLAALPCVLAAAPAVFLLRATPAQAQPLPERRVISGRVVGADGKGVPKATVTLQRESDIGPAAFWGSQTATDASGAFSFPEAEDGAYFISVEADGYAPQQNKPLRVDDSSSTYTSRLERLVQLKLRIAKADGSPLKSTRVTVRLGAATAGGAFSMVRRPTDAQGILAVPNQVPGTYAIDVVAAGEGYSSARDVAVKFSEKPEPVEVKLQKGGALKVTARDANDASKYLGGASLSLSAALDASDADRRTGRLLARSAPNLQNLYAYSADGSSSVTRDGDGALEMSDLPPGRYRAKLVLPSYAPSETREVEVKAGEVSEASFELAPQSRASSLKLRFLDRKGEPIASQDWTLQLRALGATPGNPPGNPDAEAFIDAGAGGDDMVAPVAFGVLSRRVRTDAKGEATLFPLRAGRWRVLAFPTRADGLRSASVQEIVTVGDDGGELSLTFRALIPPPR